MQCSKQSSTAATLVVQLCVQVYSIKLSICSTTFCIYICCTLAAQLHYVAAAAVPNSLLFLGRPGVGKTTVIREMARVLSDELHKRVVIVDTSNEIGGDGDVPHPAIGGARRMQVPDPSQQHKVMVALMHLLLVMYTCIHYQFLEVHCRAQW